MNCTQCTLPTFKFPTNLTPRSLIPPNSTTFLFQTLPNSRPILLPKKTFKPAKKISLRSRASASDSSETRNWVKWLPTGALAADKVLRLIAGATASPICQFVSSPTTFLHSLDPRVKLVCSKFFGNLFTCFDWDALSDVWLTGRPYWFFRYGLWL